MMSNQPPNPRRRWLSFSLRSLLILMVVAAMGFGWLGWKLKEARDQARAVAEIERMGGVVTYDWGPPYFEAPHLVEAPQPSEPQWLRNLFGQHLFDDVLYVTFWDLNNSVNDDTLMVVSNFKRLETLHIFFGQELTSEGLKHLVELPLRELIVGKLDMGDAELRVLREITTLRVLWLLDMELTDDLVSTLKTMQYLQYLHVEVINENTECLEELRRSMKSTRVGGTVMPPPQTDVPQSELSGDDPFLIDQ